MEKSSMYWLVIFRVRVRDRVNPQPKLNALELSDVVTLKEGNAAPRTEEVLLKTHFYVVFVLQDTERGDDCRYG